MKFDQLYEKLLVEQKNPTKKYGDWTLEASPVSEEDLIQMGLYKRGEEIPTVYIPIAYNNKYKEQLDFGQSTYEKIVRASGDHYDLEGALGVAKKLADKFDSNWKPYFDMIDEATKKLAPEDPISISKIMKGILYNKDLNKKDFERSFQNLLLNVRREVGPKVIEKFKKGTRKFNKLIDWWVKNILSKKSQIKKFRRS